MEVNILSKLEVISCT